MNNLNTYKKNLIKRTIKNCIKFSSILLIINICFYLLNDFFIYFLIFPALPIIYLIVKLTKILRYDIALGKIIEVKLENDYDVPFTYAIIEFEDKSTDKKYQVTAVITRWGDHEEGCEKELNKMLDNDSKEYINKKVPVLYKKDKPDKYILYLKDAYLEEK